MNTNNKKTAIYLALASTLVMGSSQVLAVGSNTGYPVDVTTGNWNSAFGYLSLNSNTTGISNTATGAETLRLNTTGSRNVGMGFSLFENTIGNDNTAIGYASLQKNTTGQYNTASGGNALLRNIEGIENTAVGYNALKNNFASSNAAVGAYSQLSNTTGTNNTSFGDSALYSNTLGSGNAAQGRSALYSNVTGEGNIGIGNLAGFVNSVGSNNIFIGRASGFYETTSNNLYVGNSATSTLLYGKMSSTAAAQKLGIGTITVAAGDAIAVWNGAHLTTGGVWTNASSRDLKDNIETLSTEDANAALAALSPVRYVYKNSRDEEYVGFIAEDVPDLVATNDHKSLSPMDIVAVLTTVTKELAVDNEEQKVQINEKDAEIAALRDSLAQQDAVNLEQEAAFQEQAAVNLQQEERMLLLELALTEVLRNQSSVIQVSSTD